MLLKSACHIGISFWTNGLIIALSASGLSPLRSIENLASLLEDKADYNGAEALRRRALAGSDKALGPEHPDTLCRVTTLGHLL